MAVYDQEKPDEIKDRQNDLDNDSLTPKAIQDLEKKYSSSKNEPASTGYQNQEAAKTDEDGASKEEADLNNKLGENARSNQSRPFSEDNFYNPSAKGKSSGVKGKLLSLASNKILVGGVGAGLVGVILVIVAFLGYLNVFKLDHIMKNIEQKAFMRYQVAMDKRSDRWIRSYLALRLSEIDDPSITDYADRDNLLFRSNKVDTNNPVTDWYKTLRASSFEKNLADKYGIKFTSVAQKSGNSVVFRPGIVTMKDKPLTIDFSDLSPVEISAIENFDINNFNGRLQDFVDVEVFGSDKEARIAIKKAVNSETKSWQVIKRRHVRKNIQNMIGVRDWRFFDKTRTKLEEKKINIRNKIIKKVLPESTKSGKFIQCLFGMISCRTSKDSIDIENRSTSATLNGKNNPGGKTEPDPNNPDAPAKAVGNETAEEAAERAAREGAEEMTLLGMKATFIKQLLAKINVVTTVISIVDTLSRVDKMFETGALVKMVTIARGSQAAGFFTTYMIASDQLKTGEVTGEEVGEFMQTINAVSNSEGWTSMIGNSQETAIAEESTFVAAKNKEEYCTPEHQMLIADPKNHKLAEEEFHFNCDSMKIGGPSRAKTLTEWWNKSFGSLLKPLLEFYRAMPISTIMQAIGDFVGAIIQPFVDAFLSATGLNKTIEDVMAWVMVEVAGILGAGPMLNGTEPSGVYANMIMQGGAYTAESSARYQGAILTNPQTAALAREDTIAYKQELKENSSYIDRYLSIENSESTLSQGLFAFVQNGAVNNFSSMFSQYVKKAFQAPLSIFSRTTSATTSDPYAAANFAGIETYDYPSACYDLDPLTMTPSQVSNANDVLSANGITPFTDTELTWDFVNNNTAFYDAVYSKLRTKYPDNADDYAVTIYNCAAMDSTVRGGLASLYGYTKDNGLEPGSISNGNNSAINLNIIFSDDTSNIPCADGTETADAQAVGYSNEKPVKIRTCIIGGSELLDVNSQISGNIKLLIEASRNAGLDLLTGSTGFRTMQEQIDAWNRNGCTPSPYYPSATYHDCNGWVAWPGTSNHQMGLAIDFKCDGETIRSQSNKCFRWLATNAVTYGLINYPQEPWHWSTTGH